MNPEHERYAQWDAAYVIGALSATERHEYETHLAGCAECRSLIAELTPTVALLSRVTTESVQDPSAPGTAPHAVSGTGAGSAADSEPGTRDATTLETTSPETTGPDPSIRHAVVRRARARQLRRRITVGVLVAAAGAAIALAVTIPVLRPAASPTLVPMTNLVQSPLEASVALDSVPWGTRIELSCSYPAETGPTETGSAEGKVWTYLLAVVDRRGEVTTVSSWRAGPGSTATLGAGTALSMHDIGSIEIRTETGEVLTALPVSGGTEAPVAPEQSDGTDEAPRGSLYGS